MAVAISKRVQALAPSAPLAMAQKARALRDRGVEIVDFSAGQPDFDTPQPIKDAAIAALAAGDTKYPVPVAGKNPLREAVCNYLKRMCQLDYQPSQVVITVGAKDALYLAFACVLNPGDEVIIPVPYWVSYPEQVKLFDATPVFVKPAQARRGKLGGDELAAAITPRTRVIVLNSPCNPNGAVYTRAELEDLARVIRGRDILVFSDEMYHRLLLTDQPYASVAAVGGLYDQTLTINGWSKSWAMTGWRLGFVAGPEPIAAAIGRLQGQTTSGPTSFVQTAAVVALNGDQRCVEQMRAAYRERGERMHKALLSINGVQCEKPQGAFYCFPDVSATFARLGVSNADEFAEAALERGHVALVSGTPFGCSTHVRLSFATGMEQIDEGLRRLSKLLG